jgi:hypothetical protein
MHTNLSTNLGNFGCFFTLNPCPTLLARNEMNFSYKVPAISILSAWASRVHSIPFSSLLKSSFLYPPIFQPVPFTSFFTCLFPTRSEIWNLSQTPLHSFTRTPRKGSFGFETMLMSVESSVVECDQKKCKLMALLFNMFKIHSLCIVLVFKFSSVVSF